MEENNRDSALKNDFLAAYHSLLFLRTSENEIDVERRRLAMKYVAARKFESEATSTILLSQGLKKYESLLEKKEFFDQASSADKQDTQKWRSSLKDPRQAISMIKPWPCQKNSFDKICGKRDLIDRDIENLMNLEKTISNTKLCDQRLKAEHLPSSRSNSKDFQFTRNKRDRQSSLERTEQRPTFSRTENEPNRAFNRNKWERLENNVPKKTERRPEWGKIQNRNKHRSMEVEDDSWSSEPSKPTLFRTAKTELHVQQQQKVQKKSLGGKASVNSQFVCPLKRERDKDEGKSIENSKQDNDEPVHDALKGIDEKLIELVKNEIMDCGALVSWDDVAGLEHAKKIIKEIVVLPMLRPDIFTGLRRPPKGILLFGPPGTGKTLIGKCIASQSKSTFFSISASSLTSKWIGEGEKMVRALFAVARVHQPSVIFIDEIDSLLTQRSETEHESSRRIKTEFLVQLDGAATGEEDRILVIGATNRPQELDEAARRRFVKRLYVPLPEFEARRQIVVNLLGAIPHELTSEDIDSIAKSSEHYSGADVTNLCKEASMGPIRSIPYDMLENIRKEDVRCVTADDFNEALSYVRPSVSHSDLDVYVNWDRTYGSGTASLGKNREND